MLALASMLPSGPAGTPRVALGVVPTDSDLLYVQPVEGLPSATLAEVLARLGFAVEPSTHTTGVRVIVTADAPALAQRLAETGLIRSVEGDATVRATQVPTPVAAEGVAEGAEPPPLPDDPLFEEYQRAYLEAIGAPDAWATGARGEGVVIAVIDTGIDFNHPDLISRLALNFADRFFDRIDNDGNGCADDIVGCNFVSLSTADPSCGYTQPPPHWLTLDDEGHGTFVSGVAAATGDNRVGITGVAPRALILPVKVLDCTATGRISDAAAGIRYAADAGADVINISFGTPNDSPALRDAVRYAQSRGAVVVASAGNDGSSGITYPAAYPGVLAVAASGSVVEALDRPNDYHRAASFAQFGLGVDFLAPGVDVLSTIPSRRCQAGTWTCVDEQYAVASGSSFATPFVAGAVAVMLSAHPERSEAFLVNLLSTVRDPALPGESGRLVDLGAAATRPLFQAGVPDVSRDGGGRPPGPGVP